MGDTTIEWTDKTWNPVSGCSHVSAGCKNCYAEKIANRFTGSKAFPHGFKVTLHPERLRQPSSWKKPARVFVNSMSDLFHEDVPFEFVLRVWNEMGAWAGKHTFQILTKRPRRMLGFFEWCKEGMRERGLDNWEKGIHVLPNVWLGVSVENQQAADERIPLLLKTPAALRFLSCEPLLQAVDLSRLNYLPAANGFSEMFDDCLNGRSKGPAGQWLAVGPGIDWVIVGGESGQGARPMHPDWARSVRNQCQAARVPFFFKQWGEWEIASFENGHHGSVMPESNKKYTWLGRNGKTFNPSAPNDLDCYAMARVGKKKAGRLLDGREWNEFPATITKGV